GVEAVAEVNGGLQLASGEVLVNRRVAGLYVQQNQIHRLEEVVGCGGPQETRGIDAGVDAQGFRTHENVPREGALHEYLATRDGDATTGGAEDFAVALDALEQVFGLDGLAVPHVEGVGVVAIQAPQWATVHED